MKTDTQDKTPHGMSTQPQKSAGAPHPTVYLTQGTRQAGALPSYFTEEHFSALPSNQVGSWFEPLSSTHWNNNSVQHKSHTSIMVFMTIKYGELQGNSQLILKDGVII